MKWWEKAWNTAIGCTELSEECRRCWAREMWERFHPDEDFGKVVLQPHVLDDPIKRKKVKTTYFVCNLSDLFHDDIPDDYIHEVYAIMTLAYWHNFFVLTKRPKRALLMLTAPDAYERRLDAAEKVRSRHPKLGRVPISDPRKHPPANIAFGVTAGNQKRADERIPLALKVPAYRHFLSYEPALGPLDFTGHRRDWIVPFPEPTVRRTPRLDLIFAGGENHSNAAECEMRWFRRLLRDCAGTETRVCIKQIGSRPVEIDEVADDLARDASERPDSDPAEVAAMAAAAVRRIKITDRAGKNMEEWPEDLRVQQTLEFGYPKAVYGSFTNAQGSLW